MHPLGTRELEPSGRLAGSGLLTNTIGNPLDTTIALSHLIFEGTLDAFPGLKICAAHGGGFLPSYANRSDAVIRTFPNRVGPLPKKKPTAYLKDGQLFFDTIVFTPEALRHLIAETGPGQIMIGTDYPFPWTSTEVDLVLGTPGLSDERTDRHPGRNRGAAARDQCLTNGRMLSDADRIWNRACFGKPDGSALRGDRALAALLLFHKLAMNGGLLHPFECLLPRELAVRKIGLPPLRLPRRRRTHIGHRIGPDLAQDVRLTGGFVRPSRTAILSGRQRAGQSFRRVFQDAQIRFCPAARRQP